MTTVRREEENTCKSGVWGGGIYSTNALWKHQTSNNQKKGSPNQSIATWWEAQCAGQQLTFISSIK